MLGETAAMIVVLTTTMLLLLPPSRPRGVPLRRGRRAHSGGGLDRVGRREHDVLLAVQVEEEVCVRVEVELLPEAALPPVELTMPRYVAAVQRRRRVAVVQSQKEEAFWCARCDREPEDGGLPPPPQLQPHQIQR